MTKESGNDLIKSFLEKMEELKIKHYKSLSPKIQHSLKEYKALLKSEKNVEKKARLAQEFLYLKKLANLKIIGFNSGSYDLPCIVNYILEIVDPKDVSVIKRGETLFALDFRGFSFRDAMNYCGPISLAKFAEIFQLPISKEIFPYEKFESIEEISRTKSWPSYTDFKSSLPCQKSDYLDEINIILNLPFVFGIENFGHFLDFIGVKIELESSFLNSSFLPDLSEEQKDLIKKALPISPKAYFAQKFEFERKIETGEYTSFLDYLKFYNLLDCDLLTEAMKKFLEIFSDCFDVCLFERLSLPAISESIMWQCYDPGSPKMFSFSENYGFLNQKIREKLQGGPTIIFHRHAEVR